MRGYISNVMENPFQTAVTEEQVSTSSPLEDFSYISVQVLYQNFGFIHNFNALVIRAIRESQKPYWGLNRQK